MKIFFLGLIMSLSNLLAFESKDQVDLNYMYKEDNVAGKNISFKFPINESWEYQCGRYYYFYLRDEVLPLNKSFVEQVNHVEILFSPEKNISSTYLFKSKTLVINFNLDENENLQRYCSYQSVTAEVLKSFSLNQKVKPITAEIVSSSLPLPSYNSSWTFTKAIDYISRNDFDENDLTIIKRSEWGAKSAKDDMDPMPSSKIDGVVLHNTEFSKNETVRKIQDLHMGKNKWSDIGYHYVIAKYNGKWKVHEARSLNFVGAHVGTGKNEWKIGISFQGDYSKKTSSSHSQGYGSGASEYQKQPEPEAILVLGQLLAHLQTKFGRLPIIYSHGLGPYAANPGHTDCPGVGMLHIVESFRKKFR